MKLMRLRHWQSADADAALANQGETLDDLKLIHNGEVTIHRDGSEIARSCDGTLIGAMSYIQGGTPQRPFPSKGRPAVSRGPRRSFANC